MKRSKENFIRKNSDAIFTLYSTIETRIRVPFFIEEHIPYEVWKKYWSEYQANNKNKDSKCSNDSFNGL